MKDKLLEIIVNEFSDIENPKSYVDKILNNAELLVHYGQNNIIGFVAFYANDNVNKSGYITLVYVDSSCRGNKVAYNLIKNMIGSLKVKSYKDCKLEVKKDNTAAINLYKNLGFEVFHESAHSYFMEIKL